jgi:hypothetical protein
MPNSFKWLVGLWKALTKPDTAIHSSGHVQSILWALNACNEAAHKASLAMRFVHLKLQKYCTYAFSSTQRGQPETRMDIQTSLALPGAKVSLNGRE